ncbi:P-loop containing nucleoside triphosphate hydrolase protein [Dichotomopilus funicola]|uniref:Gluconokinase n=1 Tax=Dichotomopilus funicola TaxID=1934379 RepID=A0AAN6ZNZ6_9PEZI|nr:P-loop containing nucleoside triphosphate hydrolase protein [Dichotomopilus funicola]
MSSGRQSIPSSPTAARIQAALSNSIMINNATPTAEAQAKDQHIWLVTGPAGCGKSTVAKHIADSLNFEFVEGDEFHPESNVEKMKNGIPLTDADRWDWLTVLREESIQRLSGGKTGVVLTCSALKRKYRDVIRVAPYFTPNVHLHFIYLDATEEVLLKRVAARQNHFMGANMVHSQFEVLERPKSDETDVVTINVDRTLDAVKEDALDKVVKTIGDIQSS